MAVGLSPTPINVTTSTRGLVNFISNSELDRIEEEKILANRPPVPVVTLGTLESHIRTFFDSAKRAKLDIENKMLMILRQIKGEYEADKLAAIQAMGGSDDFIRLTQHKVRDCEAWIIDTINPYGDKTWDIEATPIAELPEDVVAMIKTKVRSRLTQQAIAVTTAQGTAFDSSKLISQMKDIEEKITKQVKKKAQELAQQRANNMKKKILDQLEEGGWNKAFKACVNDLSRLKSCIMKGPVFRKIPSLKYIQDTNGKYIPKVSTDPKPTFSRVSPFDWYPSAKSDDVDNGDAIEIEHISISDLQKMINVPGYKNDVIRGILNNYPNGFRENLTVSLERQELEKDNSIVDDSGDIKYDMVNYWGLVIGKLLIEYGTTEMDGEPIIEDEYYNVNIKVIDNQIIKDPITNPDPLGRKPYGVTSFVKNNDSQWGECPAELMTDLQSICNATVRPLVNNIAIASGPICEMDAGRLAPGESGELWPWKRILTTNKNMQEGHAVQFYQASLLADQLLAVYEKFKREADDLVVPSYGRSDIGGAGRTSSGLAMLMTAAARNVKLAIYNIDQDIIISNILRLFDFNMVFIDDDSIKGDIHIKARGTSAIVAKEQLAVRRNEFRGSLRPTEEQLLGARGLAYILRKTLESLDIDADKAMPGYGDLEELDGLDMLPSPEATNIASQIPKPAMIENGGAPMGGAPDASLFRQPETENE